MNTDYPKIIEKLGKNRVQQNEPLSSHTTFKIGGPADLFYEAKTTEEITKAVNLAREFEVPYFVLGGGSNLLVSDEGFRGLVIKNSASGMKILGELEKPKIVGSKRKAPHGAADPKKYLKVDDLDYQDEPLVVRVRVCSGTPLQRFIRWCFDNGFTGLQLFAGIPGTIGGAVISNIHGYTRLFSDYVGSVSVIDNKGLLKRVDVDKIAFGYDFSDISRKYLAVVDVDVLLARGNVAKAKSVYDEWWSRKLKVQPQKNCPGSIFKNISEEKAKQVGAPTPSVGWFIDQCGLKGKTVGGATVSEMHANFIVNKGNATAADVIALIKLIKEKVKEKFDIILQEEIKLVGFARKEDI